MATGRIDGADVTRDIGEDDRLSLDCCEPGLLAVGAFEYTGKFGCDQVCEIGGSEGVKSAISPLCISAIVSSTMRWYSRAEIALVETPIWWECLFLSVPDSMP